MNEAPVFLVACASCGAHPTATWYVTEVQPPHPFHCPKCRPGLVSAEEQLSRPDAVVGFIDAAPASRWCVIDVLADGYFTCRPLGLPSFPLRTRHISEVRPLFSYAKLEQSRRK